MFNFRDRVLSLLFALLTTVIAFILPSSTIVYSQPCGQEYFTGIDVSEWQGDIDWQEVKKTGQVQFAIIRTSYGWSKRDEYTDKQLDNNIKGAKSVGIPIGAYHYSYATTVEEAKLEADFFISRLERTTWEYPVFMDIEDKAQLKLTNKQRTDIMLAFMEKVKEKGYCVGFYTNLNWSRNYLDMDRLAPFNLWMAQWNENCTSEHSYGIWQKSSEGSISGIKGNVDLDVCYVNYPEIIKEKHLNGY